MLRSMICRFTKHLWGENRAEVTPSGRRIVRLCTRCGETDTVAVIRDLEPSWKPNQFRDGSPRRAS